MLITCPKCSSKYKIPPELRLTEGKKVQCSTCGHLFRFHSETKIQKEEIKPLLPPEDAVLSVKTKETFIKMADGESSSFQQKPVLPEVFRPLQSPREHAKFPYFWILLCTILLIGFMIMAWLYRELLMNRSLEMSFMPQIQHIERKKHVPDVSKQKEDKEVASVFVVPKVDEKPVVEEKTLFPQPHQMLSVQSVRFRKTPTREAVLIEGSLKNTTSEVLPVPPKIYALGYNTQGKLVFDKEIYLPAGILYPDMEQPFFGTYEPITEEIQWVDVVLEK